ncbi:hypothetical protein chiPu_0012039 [Chiloscyllium punctatum]|uniref:Uncharacterized protein n=1 Tax=Chiloscyllium punctatum TaxID=137246 RepID=A0A401ST58_CHIPU|nr:hypothetical protein [Chiloscyllium punctatum]
MDSKKFHQSHRNKLIWASPARIFHFWNTLSAEWRAGSLHWVNQLSESFWAKTMGQLLTTLKKAGEWS